jgi:hypothetical protein
MKVATILINFNDEENAIRLAKTLEKYEDISRVIIVDNLSSNQNSYKKLKEFEKEYIEKNENDNNLRKISVIQADKNGGYNYGLNYGIHYLEVEAIQNEITTLDDENKKRKDNVYDVIMCSNTDIEISEEAIKMSLKKLNENSKIALVAPRMLNKDKQPIRRSSWKLRTFARDVVHSSRILEILFYKKLRDGEYLGQEYKQEALQVEAISGSCFFIKYNILKELNYFDDNTFLFYEEDMLGFKLKEKGYETYSLNNVNFIHYESQSIEKTINYYKKMKQLFKSKMYYQKKYNKINTLQIICFYLLWIIRNIELIIEIPVRKIMGK